MFDALPRTCALGVAAALLGGCTGLPTERCDQSFDTACGEVVGVRTLEGVAMWEQRALPDGSVGYLGTHFDAPVIALRDAGGEERWSTPLEPDLVVVGLDFDDAGRAAVVRHIGEPDDDGPGDQLSDVIRFDEDGQVLWQTSIPSPPGWFIQAAALLDDDGGVLAAVAFGEMAAILGQTQLTRLTPDGAIEWQVTRDFTALWLVAGPAGGTRAVGQCALVDWRHPCLLSLASDGTEIVRAPLEVMLEHPRPTPAGGLIGGAEWGLAEIDASGALLWRREFEKGECTGEGSGDGCGQGGSLESLAVAPDGTLAASARFRDGADLGAGDVAGGRWVARFAADGAHIWSRQVDADCTTGTAGSVATTPTGEISYRCVEWIEGTGTPPGDAGPTGSHFVTHLLRFRP